MNNICDKTFGTSANEQEETLGYIAEEPRGILATFSRQLFRTHRPFRAIVMDAVGTPVLWVVVYSLKTRFITADG